jgi:hypothetical protein
MRCVARLFSALFLLCTLECSFVVAEVVLSLLLREELWPFLVRKTIVRVAPKLTFTIADPRATSSVLSANPQQIIRSKGVSINNTLIDIKFGGVRKRATKI